MTRRLETLVSYVSLAAVVLSLMPLAARLGWVFELTAQFSVQYVVVDALLAIALAAQRKPVLAALLAACAALSSWPVLPYVALGGTPAVAAAPRATIKVLSANVFFRNRSATRLLDIIRRESPDVVLLVEYTPRWAAQVDELRAAYPYRLEGAGVDPYGFALFSRYELASAKAFDLGDTSAVDARILTPEGAVTLLGVHLRSPMTPSREAMRNRQLDDLAARVTRVKGPLVVIGDFNVTPYSPYFADWLARSGLTDTRRGRTLSPSWPTMLPIVAIPIDHCAVSRDVTIVAHRGLPAFGSDHYPILAELALAPASSNKH